MSQYSFEIASAMCMGTSVTPSVPPSAWSLTDDASDASWIWVSVLILKAAATV